jgi:hypothetical protein
LFRVGDSHCFQGGVKECPDDAAAVPRLEDGVQDEYEKSVAYGFGEKDAVVPEPAEAIGFIVLDRLFDVGDHDIDNRLASVARICHILCDNTASFLVLVLLEEATWRFRTPPEDGDAYDHRKQAFQQ